ncbi:MAG: REP-associated tyrosine transposase [Peptococcaceae bacterium]
MPRVAREKSASGIYHIMIRGANKQEIFHDDEDKLRFLEILKKYKLAAEMEIYGWCLMSNHLHLLLKEGDEDLSVTMKRIGVSFVWYYNQKYKTTGHLFQDRFRSEKVESNEYLLSVLRYIHQNPRQAGMVKKLENWQWSSCPGYYGQNIVPVGLLNTGFVLQMFADVENTAMLRFREFNERENNDRCLDVGFNEKVQLSDEKVREEILKLITGVEIAQIKSLPKIERDKILQKVKKIEGITQRQAARILGVSPNLIFKA